MTQGVTLEEAANNLREIVALALDGENLAELGLAPRPIIMAVLEFGVTDV